MITRKIVPLIFFASTILHNLLKPETDQNGLQYTEYIAMITLVGTCLELIRYVQRILKVNEVRWSRNELLIGYMAVILWAMRSRYLQCYSGYDEKVYSPMIATVSTPRQSILSRLLVFTETQILLAIPHFYLVSAAIDTGNRIQLCSWILSFMSSQHIYKILVSQRPEPAPAAPAATINIRDQPEARAEPRAEVPDNHEEEENFGTRIQAAWYPIGQSIEEKNHICFDLLIGRFKNFAAPFKIRNAVNKMEEKRRHRDQKNELLGLPNFFDDTDFFDDLENVTGITGYINLEVGLL
ncbi:hypothetical protein GCK72_011325 [Caenorhabditis remanei]|uniref:Uncharacterized protein n=1 Tax=Caenorhabditis remanei TaxID=31234 RepID=A0A6A5H5F9_CAERE|nr:hypothetical protein GCK72_011325 [Caenorhabditis remanei]KAF1763060.1 hypothetical protein GCK72_011325 [Caenorhabditis remanei]